MAAILKYRFPGSDIESYSGEFEKLNNLEEINGFIVSDFEGKNIFRFKESFERGNFHLSQVQPFCSAKEEYLKTASSFLEEIRSHSIGKAVLSRVKRVNFDDSKCDELFYTLEKKYPDTLVYLISSEQFGTWIGATPEKLVESQNDQFYTMALAGTLPFSDKSEWGQKEKDEQQQVTDFILDRILSLDAHNIQTMGPNEVMAGPVRHLRTDINFTLKQDSAFELARILHPTPAVSGMPRKDAIDLIHKYEKHDRSLYAGILGYVSQNSCKLYVNLRCCTIQEKSAYLFIGGGFTKYSDVEKEWIETENKSRTLLNLIEEI